MMWRASPNDILSREEAPFKSQDRECPKPLDEIRIRASYDAHQLSYIGDYGAEIDLITQGIEVRNVDRRTTFPAFSGDHFVVHARRFFPESNIAGDRELRTTAKRPLCRDDVRGVIECGRDDTAKPLPVFPVCGEEIWPPYTTTLFSRSTCIACG